ncbi:FecR family protein [Pseudomonas sp. SL4(2022)]|uniref:FecR family protein n=1 Tax=Pseudomonas sp. SL4(2022) TaxID=2994661 RepID=UPI00226DF873|nr:FecR family protein [Pseudomonas sp. SL4(2022)]WAC44318.1 FecR family protein [Pseudomonas sp. SL4(2022)]
MNVHSLNQTVIDEQAAVWFSRCCRGLSSDEQAQLDAWLTADISHVCALADMQRVWADFDLMPRPVLLPGAVLPMRRVRRWTPGRALAASVVLLCSVLATPQNWFGALPVQELSLSSEANEQRQVELADGTRIDLNVGSRLQVRLYPDHREAELLDGEAFFAVAPDVARPFEVIAGQSRVRVVGTRFSVRRSREHLAVAVESGRVMVQPQLGSAQQVMLGAGEGLAFDHRSKHLQQLRLGHEEIASWRRGLLVFRDRPLGLLLDELSHYRAAPVRLVNTNLAEKRISGSLNINDPDAFLAALPHLLPVRVEHQGDDGVLIHAQ